MDNLKLTLIKLIKSGLTGENLGPIDIADFGELIKLTAAHHVIMPVYYGMLNSKVKIPDDIAAAIKNATLRLIYISNNQHFELDRLFDALKAEKIDFVPLKGSVLKSFYPKPEMRHMTDADIFIRTEQLDKIGEIAKKLGYVIPDNYKETTVPKINFSSVDKTLELCAKNGIEII